MDRLLSSAQEAFLRKIGLSRHAVELYCVLLSDGAKTSAEAACSLEVFPSALYRLFYELEEHGLVRRRDGRPRKFEALPIGDGMQVSLHKKEAELQALVAATAVADGDLANVLVGRQAVYDAYMRYAKTATSQICIYSIGIAYSKQLARTQVEARKRGVKIRQVVQEVKAGNYFVISRWLQIGVELRHLRRNRGYHVTIIDDRVAIVTFSNPKDTDQRVSLLTTNYDIIAIFQTQFESVWQRGKEIPADLLGRVAN